MGIALPALDLKTPQQPDLLAQYAQIQQIRGQQQQQQMAQQEAPLRMQALQQNVQQGGLDIQQKQQAIDDQKATTAAMQGWDGKSLEDLPALILKHGGSATAVMGMKTHILEQKAKISTMAKDDSTTGKNQIETQMQKNNALSGALGSLMRVPDEQLSQAIGATAQQLMQQGVLDPQHGQAAQQLAQLPPAQARQQLDIMRKGVTSNSQLMEQTRNEQTALNEKAMREQAAANAKETHGYHQQEIGVRQQQLAIDRQKLAIEKGDPNAAAQLLVNGDATLSELKARGSTPAFIEQTLNAARQLSGGKYNAQSADAQFSVAKSPANVAFFGSAKSLTDKGGTLDQLAAAGKDIPGGLIPAFNSIGDWEKAATGSGPIAKYAALALGVADDYAKVMGGGQGSDSSRMQALQLVGAKQSPAQREASISGIRGAVGSQATSRIGNNGVLKRMYGDADAAPAASGGFDWNSHPVAK